MQFAVRARLPVEEFHSANFLSGEDQSKAGILRNRFLLYLTIGLKRLNYHIDQSNIFFPFNIKTS